MCALEQVVSNMLMRPCLATRRRTTLCLLIASCLPVLAGCDAFRAMAVMAQPPTEKVNAEFNRLEGKKTLVYVWGPADILWDYPKVRLDLAAYISAYLEKNVKKITVVPAVRVESYLEEISSPNIDPVEVGKHFEAEMVVHVSIFQLSMRDPGYANLYKGRLGGSIVVWDMSKSGEPAERVPLRDVVVTVPPGQSVGMPNTRPEQIRQATYDTFAVEVGRKFHEWERPNG